MTNHDALIDFLLARIDERGKLARRMDVDGWSPGTAVDTFGAREVDDLVAAYWDEVGAPSRVLAECESKRRIVKVCAAVIEDDDGRGYYSDGWDGLGLAKSILRQLALPYADHPDYQEAWRS